MSLLDDLGIEAADFVWQDLALCVGLDANLFFDSYETDVEVAKQVDECCLSCPVMKECSAKGLNGEYGVFGGVYWNGSGKPDFNRNAHKTDAVWAKIRERITS